jgi:hypothetical protein
VTGRTPASSQPVSGRPWLSVCPHLNLCHSITMVTSRSALSQIRDRTHQTRTRRVDPTSARVRAFSFLRRDQTRHQATGCVICQSPVDSCKLFEQVFNDLTHPVGHDLTRPEFGPSCSNERAHRHLDLTREQCSHDVRSCGSSCIWSTFSALSQVPSTDRTLPRVRSLVRCSVRSLQPLRHCFQLANHKV